MQAGSEAGADNLDAASYINNKFEIEARDFENMANIYPLILTKPERIEYKCST